MGPDKSDSFTFHRNSKVTSSNSSDSRIQNCRRRLQDKFDKAETASNSSERHERSVLSTLSLNDTRRVWKSSAEKISKTFGNVRTSFGSLSQKFKMPTRRRQILEEGPMTPNCATPQTISKAILGRTPTKLYSPFSIESPNPNIDKENCSPTNLQPTKKTTKIPLGWTKVRNLLDDIHN